LFRIAIIFLAILLSELMWSQNLQSDSLINELQLLKDSTGQDMGNTSIHLFNNNLNKFYIYDLNESIIEPLYQDYINRQFNPDYIYFNSLEEQWRVNEQLVNYIKFRKGLALKTKLGVFGEILGYANNISAIVLAIIHLIKYRKVLY